MADFSRDQGDFQNVGPTTKAPKGSTGAPKTGFSEAPKSKHADFGPGEGIQPSNRKIH